MGLSINMNKTGIKSQQLALDAISNNIANATTDGYKAKAVRFQSLLNNQVTEEDVLLNDTNPSITAGARGEVSTTDFSQGSLREGTSSLNLSVVGDGFFGVENSAGEFFLTRDGSFTIDGTGRLVNGNGDYLVMNGQLPLMTSGELVVGGDGSVSVIENGVTNEIGQVNIYMPGNVEGLQPVGENYFVDPNNDRTILANPVVEANVIEQSNVDLAQELTNMIIAQRAYSLNVKVAQSTDEMMSLINQFSI